MPSAVSDLMESVQKGKPVQVVSINKDHTYTLNEEALKEILTHDEVKDLPVSVVSVAGAFRKGKSFILSFFIRYLESQGNDDWLGKADVPLEGFHWRGGCEPDTSGILMWSKPFVVTLPTGDKVAVVLMDTQGTFDCESTMNDCATIFALSTMLSSVQVYNISSNIQENDLTNLQMFAEYGKLALKESGCKPFQKLHFLVRDWMSPDEHNYGLEGGEQLLQKRLQIKEGQHDEQSRVRKFIKSCFEETTCFLMPHPGLDVIEKKFDGRIKDLRGAFVEELPNLVRQLLATENLIPKKIANKQIKAKELFSYFTTYVVLFRDGTMPAVQSIVEATAEANNRTAVAGAEELYYKGIQEGFDSCKSYLKQDELEDLHKQQKSKAMDYFHDEPKFGGNEFSDKFGKILEERINIIIVDFTARNIKTKIAIEATLQASVETAKDFYRKKGQGLLQKEKHMSSENLSVEHEQMKCQAVELFHQHLDLADNEVLRPYLELLEKDLDTEFAVIERQNKKNLETVESELICDIKISNENYRFEMKKLIGDQKKLPNENQLRRKHTELKDLELTKISATLQKFTVGVETCDKFIGAFNKDIDATYQELLTELRNAGESVEVKNKSQVAAASEFYRSSMQQQFGPSKPLLDWKALQAEHFKRKSDARDILKSKLITSSASGTRVYMKSLDDAMERFYENFKSQNETAWETASANCNAAKAKAKDFYETKMRARFAEHHSYYTVEDLHDEHVRTKDAAMQQFKEQPNTGDAAMTQAAIENLGKEIDSKMNEFLKMNDTARKISEDNILNAKGSARERYRSEMSAAIDQSEVLLSDAELRIRHENIKADAVDHFKKQHTVQSAQQVNDAIIALEKELDNIFLEYSARNCRMHMMESKANSNSMLLNAHSMYRSKMQAELNSSESYSKMELRRRHESIKSDVRETCGRQFEDDEEGLAAFMAQYEQEMEKLYPEFEQQMVELKKRVEDANSFACSSAKELYRSKMNGLYGVGKTFLTEQELLREHNNIKNVAINHFMRQPDIGGNEISKMYLNNLQMALETIFQEYKDRNKQCMLATARHKYVNAVASAKDYYVTRMQEKFNITDFRYIFSFFFGNKHSGVKQEALDYFERCRPKYGPQEYHEKHLAQLEKEIAAVDDRFEEMRADRKRREDNIRRETEESCRPEPSGDDCVIL